LKQQKEPYTDFTTVQSVRMPYGRGGAGNFEEATRQSSTPIAKRDLEANPPSTATPVPAPPDQFAYSGRGGAGNYYSPAVLSQQGTFSTTPSTTASRSGQGDAATAIPAPASDSATASAAVPFAGRGGAGNYSFSDERKLLEAEVNDGGDVSRNRDPDGMTELVELDVERGLAKPQQAHVNEAAPAGKSQDIWQGTI